MLRPMTNPAEQPGPPPPPLAVIHAQTIDVQPTTGPDGAPVVILHLRNPAFTASIMVGPDAARDLAELLVKGTSPRLEVATPGQIAAIGRTPHNGRRN